MLTRNFISLPKHWRLAGIVFLLILMIALPIVILPRLTQRPQKIGKKEVQGATTLNPIQLENEQPGDTSWVVTKPSLNGEIQAYAGYDSINRGGAVDLYVSTKVPDTYRIDIYRLGEYNGRGGRLMQTISNNPGTPQGYYPVVGPQLPAPLNCPTCIISMKDSKGQETYITDANWKVSVTLTFLPQWISGIYEIELTERQGYQWLVPLVVRDDGRKADLVFEDPLNTDEAQNEWGGASNFKNYRTYGPTGEPANSKPPSNGALPSWAFYLSYNRPNLLGYGAGSLFAWTYPMIRFLEQRKYDVTYTTNNAVAEGLTKLQNYKGFLSAGHDEYVSFAERQKIQQAVTNGMSIAFFGANNMLLQTRSLPDMEGRPDRILVEYRDYFDSFDPYDSPGNPNRELTTTLWRSSPVNDPEDRLLKAMSPLDGWCVCVSNFIVTDTHSWVFNKTGLKDGDVIPGILGSEIDTIFPGDSSITLDDYITVVGQSPFIAADGTKFVANAVLDEFGTNDYITIAGQVPYALGHHNIIFDAGTLYWARAISENRASANTPESPALEQMTDNILQKMIHPNSEPD